MTKHQQTIADTRASKAQDGSIFVANNTTMKRCSNCKKLDYRIVKHHEDYSRPHEVVLLCHSCHAKRHHELGWGIPGNPHPSRRKTCLKFLLKGKQFELISILAKRNRRTPTKELEIAIMMHLASYPIYCFRLLSKPTKKKTK